MDTADSAQNKAQEALDSIYSIGQTLPDKKLLVAEIPQKIDDINRAMDRAASRLRKLNEMVPQAQDLLNDMSAQKDKMKDLGMKALSNLTELQDKIERAQDQANRIEVAMGFRKTTTVRLRSVPNNEDASASSSISLFFKTKENNGFLAFLGGQGGGDDYMALEIVDGNVVFYYDLGSGFAEIKSNKKVADDVWHQAVGERVGMSGTLTIKTDKENDDETTGRSPPSFSVFDLTASAQFFVGGVPQEFGLPANIKISRFIGCIDDLKFMGLAIGLWNFAEAVNADRGCKERSVLQAPPENIFTLNGGDSYVILPKGNINIYQRTEISFQMKTFADTGLLFFAGKGTDFISVELRNGHVLFQYDFGSGVAEIMSAEKCNSGNWTRVTAQRNKQAGSLTINKNDAVRGTSPGNHHGLETSDVLYLGGVKGIKVPSAVTSVSYMGCLKDVLVQRKAWDDLYVNEGSKGLYSGCQDRAARTAAFTRTDSYIAMPGVNINRNSDISLRFKTQQPSGLMVFATNDDQSNSFSIAMVDGGVVVQTDVSNDISTVESNKKRYDDGEWHFVNFEKKGTGLSLVIDDTDTKEVDGTGKKKTTTSSPIYFGGTPSGYDITSQVPTRDEFIGCISDVSINSRLQDFAQSESAEDVSLAGCPLGADEDTFAAIVASPVTASPIQNEKITTTQSTVDKVAGCALPLRPSVNEADSEDGIKFGDVVESRFEYDALADKLDNKRSVFYISFKTSASHGLIFYAADDRQIDFISLYMFDGGVVYSFNCGTGTLILQSPLKYNDGNWHTVKFLREQQQGTLEIDGVQVARGEAGGAARKITVTPPFYVGGIPDTMSAKNVH
uniref:Laminin-like protein epi-1-like n=1 Tax=Saccoglossus kowalevskii TaxID=10224 RepID=A0ABM0M685_SACKO